MYCCIVDNTVCDVFISIFTSQAPHFAVTPLSLSRIPSVTIRDCKELQLFAWKLISNFCLVAFTHHPLPPSLPRLFRLLAVNSIRFAAVSLSIIPKCVYEALIFAVANCWLWCAQSLIFYLGHICKVVEYTAVRYSLCCVWHEGPKLTHCASTKLVVRLAEQPGRRTNKQKYKIYANLICFSTLLNSLWHLVFGFGPTNCFSIFG